jgi:DNA-binding CsgD family transcriptional regulator
VPRPDTALHTPFGSSVPPALPWAEFRARFGAGSPLLALLSPAERDVTMQVRLGLSNKEIADVLGKSTATVKAQVASILRKLETPTRGRLIAWLHVPRAERTVS